MTTLNPAKPYGVVYGHDTIRYTQDGKNYDARHREVGAEAPKPGKVQKTVASAAPISSAKAFLLQILKENPVSKSAIYKEAENNNQNWDEVKNAAIELGIVKFSTANLEMWKLPEGAAV